MKLALIPFILLVSLSCGDSNNKKLKFSDLVGEYEMYKNEVIEVCTGGWNYSKRHERVLMLMADSTFNEINTSFEAFDFVDYYGKWTLKNDLIFLNPIGQLEFNNGNWTRAKKIDSTFLDLKRTKLKIESEDKLKVLQNGFLKNEILSRID